jgi:hypothetical protein
MGVATTIPVRPADESERETRHSGRAVADGGDNAPDGGGPLRDLARLVYYLVKAYDAVRDFSKYGRRLLEALDELRRRLR